MRARARVRDRWANPVVDRLSPGPRPPVPTLASLALLAVMAKGGMDLYDFLDKHPKELDEPLIRKIVHQSALVLDHCHGRGVVHRDIKPEARHWVPSTRLSLSLLSFRSCPPLFRH